MGAIVGQGQLDSDGYVVLPAWFDPDDLVLEVRSALHDAFATNKSHTNIASAGNSFRYVPMMSERTPESLQLMAQLGGLASDLLGQTVLPGRAKGTRYIGSTAWHRDSEGPLKSLGMLCYLDPLDQHTGALQVQPGSHRPPTDPAGDGTDPPPRSGASLCLPTRPGDLIVLDEHTLHASLDGDERLQWRVDFVVDDEKHDAELVRYYCNQHAPGWNGGYDPDLFPSYGHAWRELDARWTTRLKELGALDLAEAEEQSMRSSTDTSSS